MFILSRQDYWNVIDLSIIVAATVVGWFIVGFAIKKILKPLNAPFPQSLFSRIHKVLMLLLPSVALLVTLTTTRITLPKHLNFIVIHISEVLVILSCTWLGIALVRVTGDTVKRRHPADLADNYSARSVRTQITVMERVASVVVLIFGVSVTLMSFPAVRAIGASLLASAGLAGLVVGFAARPVLENLLAGVQIALTRPINLDDVVVIDGYWGRIEEITTTYVVLAVWDQRRLILPFSRIISSPFENWTRRHAEILGTVYLYLDYHVPVHELRTEVERICHDSPDWDGRVCGLVVTDSTQQSMQVRALVSAADSSKAWNLRCLVREKLIEFVRTEYPQYLPRLRLGRAEQGSSGKGPNDSQ